MTDSTLPLFAEVERCIGLNVAALELSAGGGVERCIGLNTGKRRRFGDRGGGAHGSGGVNLSSSGGILAADDVEGDGAGDATELGDGMSDVLCTARCGGEGDGTT